MSTRYFDHLYFTIQATSGGARISNARDIDYFSASSPTPSLPIPFTFLPLEIGALT